MQASHSLLFKWVLWVSSPVFFPAYFAVWKHGLSLAWMTRARCCILCIYNFTLLVLFLDHDDQRSSRAISSMETANKCSSWASSTRDELVKNRTLTKKAYLTFLLSFLMLFRQHKYSVQLRLQKYLVWFSQHKCLVRFRRYKYLVRCGEQNTIYK